MPYHSNSLLMVLFGVLGVFRRTLFIITLLSITMLLLSLHWLPVYHCIHFKIFTLCRKVLASRLSFWSSDASLLHFLITLFFWFAFTFATVCAITNLSRRRTFFLIFINCLYLTPLQFRLSLSSFKPQILDLMLVRQLGDGSHNRSNVYRITYKLTLWL